jgi:hypothetical protein
MVIFGNSVLTASSATIKGGSLGGVIGTAIGAAGVMAASRRYHSFRALTVPFRAFLVASTGTFVGTFPCTIKLWSSVANNATPQPSSPQTEPPRHTISNTHPRRSVKSSVRRNAKPSTNRTRPSSSAPKTGQPRTDTRCSLASGSLPWLVHGTWSTATHT